MECLSFSLSFLLWDGEWSCLSYRLMMLLSVLMFCATQEGPCEGVIVPNSDLSLPLSLQLLLGLSLLPRAGAVLLSLLWTVVKESDIYIFGASRMLMLEAYVLNNDQQTVWY